MKVPVTFLFFICFLGDFVSFLEALKIGEEGVCVVKVSVRKSRQKAVTVNNKWCGKRKCIIKRVEHYTVPENRAVCCKGYEYDVNSEVCSPTCSTGCVGGRCSAPDTCQCDPPAYLDTQQNNICITPVVTTTQHNTAEATSDGDNKDIQTCNPPCVGSHCINQTCFCEKGFERRNDYTCILPKCNPMCVNSECIDQTCVCKDGFEKVNETLCLKCDPGFKLNGSNCTPMCDEPCVNSTCDSPNKCTCLEGFRRKNEYICEPICNCVNSTCIGPYNCSCLEGFERVNDTVCKPKCDSCDGLCIEPNICQCFEGFGNDNGTCKPMCAECENGVCSAPNICLCNEGYIRNETISKCVRHCKTPITTDARYLCR